MIKGLWFFTIASLIILSMAIIVRALTERFQRWRQGRDFHLWRLARLPQQLILTSIAIFLAVCL
jgi:hypothetical protein